MKVGSILKQRGEILSNIINRPIKIIPEIIEEDSRQFQRNQILKSYITFQQEINDKYTHKYLSTLYGLLFKNEKKYYIKRNMLNVNNPETFKCEPFPMTFSPLASLKKSRNNKVISSCCLSYYNSFSPKKSFNNTSYNNGKESFISMTQRCKRANEKNISSLTSSQENSRWLDIVHTTDNCVLEHRNTIKEREMRRLNGFKDCYAIPTTTPLSSKDIDGYIKGNSPKRKTLSNRQINSDLLSFSTTITPFKLSPRKSQVIKLKSMV